MIEQRFCLNCQRMTDHKVEKDVDCEESDKGIFYSKTEYTCLAVYEDEGYECGEKDSMWVPMEDIKPKMFRYGDVWIKGRG